MSKLIPVVLLLPLLSACSTLRLLAPIPQPPANLASNCGPIPQRPEPFLDPDRTVWETETVTAYGDCAKKHALTVEAWNKAAASK